MKNVKLVTIETRSVKHFAIMEFFKVLGNSRTTQNENKPGCSNCSRCGEVEMVIYFRNALDVKNIERNGVKNEHNDCC